MAQEGHMLISMTTLMVGRNSLPPKWRVPLKKGLPNNKCPLQRDRVGAMLSYQQ